MVAFVQGRPVSSARPVVSVDAGLAPGIHRFQLVVVDSAGLRSRVDEVRVEISRLVVPVTPIGPLTPITPITPVTPINPVTPLTPVTPIPPPPRPRRPRRKP